MRSRASQRISPSQLSLRRGPRAPAVFAAIVLLLAGALAGCGSSVRASASADVFTVGQVAPINKLTPFPWSNSNRVWIRALFDPLVSIDPGAKGETTPKITGRLASSWDTSPDGRTYTFHIRHGARFNSGRRLDADAVIDMLKWASKPVNNVSSNELIASAKITEPDGYTVRMAFPQAVPQLLSTLALTPILDVSRPDVAVTPSGVGAYRVTGYASNSLVTLTRNDDYWDKSNKGRYDQVKVRVYLDNSSADAALSSGQIDALAFPSFIQLPELKKQGFHVTQTSPAGNFMLLVHSKSGPLANVDVRRAVSAALDRKAFAQVSGGKVAKPDCSMYPPGSVAYTEKLATSCSLDLKKAKALLERAGYGHGLSLTLNISSTFYPEEASFGPILKEDLAKIGVDLRLNDLWGPTCSRRWTSGTTTSPPTSTRRGNVDPAQLFSSSKFATGENTEDYTDPTYAHMVAAAQGELDPAKRTALYRQLNSYMMDHAFVIPIATRPFVYVSRPEVKNLPVDPNGMLMEAQLTHE